jgi:N-methylhydantoinase A
LTRDRIGIDTGGTFTDFVWIDKSGLLRIHKGLSTPDDASQAVLIGIDSMGVHDEVGVVHGSTVATNAVLERRGARTALITTAGFADVLAIGRQDRPDLYALVPQKPAPLVPRHWRFEVTERVNSSAEIEIPLETGDLLPIWERITADKIDSIAICLLFSFLRPEHERRIADELRRLAVSDQVSSKSSGHGDIFLSLSSEVLPEFREYERTSTTVINAYVAPIMNRYLGRLSDGLAPRKLSVMQSNGGITSVSQASAQAARTVLSGPAGGVVGARYISNQANFSRIITFDMGGTSTDVALCDNQLPLTGEGEIAGQPMRLPMIDIHTVGAGGGSIARIDAGGALHVGPQSAGADPGPACYPRRKLMDDDSPINAIPLVATTTDANLVLGRLDAKHFLGGEMILDLDRAERAIEAIAKDIGSDSVQHAAWDIVSVANATMERAIRKISVERGFDPRRFTLLAFGGAGPVHACDLASGLNIPRVMIPASPGVLSALGMLAAPPTKDYSRTIMTQIGKDETSEAPWLLEHFALLRKRAIDDMAMEGFDLSTLSFVLSLDMRYVGQSHELRVDLAGNSSNIKIAQRFHEAHNKRYGYQQEGAQVEIVHQRLTVVANIEPPRLPRIKEGSPDPSGARIGEKEVWFEDRLVDTQLLERSSLNAGNQFHGPAIVFQYDATTVIPPKWSAHVDKIGNLILSNPEGID